MSEPLIFNLPQMITMLARQKHKMLVMGRGAGKSTIIGKHIVDVVHSMPRSAGVIVGETYQQILTRTLPSTIASLERLGYKKDLHFFVGRRAPKSFKFEEPYEPPLDYTHFMHWYTGAGFHFVSQDRPGAGRGLNTDVVIGDEAATLEQEKLFYDVLATNRANVKRWKDNPLHHSTFFATTHALTQRGRWIYKREEEALRNPAKQFYIEASAEENRANLPEDWFHEQRINTTEFLYNIEILNHKPKQIEGGFYSNLDDRHYYTNYNYGYYDGLDFGAAPASVNCLGDADLNPDEPLILGADWGSSINCLVVCQQHGKEFRILKNFFVKAPKILDAVFEEGFLPYYSRHRKKEVFFWYDRNGNSKNANSEMTYFEQAERILVKAGWTVHRMTYGLDPAHRLKYLLWAVLLQENNPRLPRIRINKQNCKELIVSMLNTPVEDKDGIKKVKKSERNKALPQEEATHFGDAADLPVYGMFQGLLNADPIFIEPRFI
jgi:hypothetical protein